MIDLSSATCHNAADLIEGTELTVETVATDNGVTRPPTSSAFTTGPRVASGGAYPVSIKQTFVDRPTSSLTTYKDAIDGNVLTYGLASSDSATGFTFVSTLQPPSAAPIVLQPGQVYSSTYEQKSTNTLGTGSTEQTATIQYEVTYVGREAYAGPLGSFDTCKFSSKTTTTTAAAPLAPSVTFTAAIEIWVAAEGPYRGQLLKSRTPPQNDSLSESTTVATKMTYSPAAGPR
ncbi:MAG: hypothetical protein JSS14_24895 [Proteobacteria bacterium]|nr:hypothetical protein [Pseudomonadota bacterium]